MMMKAWFDKTQTQKQNLKTSRSKKQDAIAFKNGYGQQTKQWWPDLYNSVEAMYYTKVEKI